MAKKQRQRTDADRRQRQCERLGRLLQLLHLIMGKGRWDVDTLAAELRCSRRTVYRLLQTLSTAGVPWYLDETSRAYRVRPGFTFSLMDLDSTSPPLPSDLAHIVQKLIADGEAYVITLQQTLKALKRLLN